MSGRPQQLVLDLPVCTATGSENFLITQSNQDAVSIIEAWPDWPAPGLLMVGAPGVGKSHLASVWQSRSGAAHVPYHELGNAAIAAFQSQSAIIVEDLDDQGPERQLFHLLNLARERRGAVLITSRTPAGDLEIALPDLRSRLRALPVATLFEPDDVLLQGLLVKLFADRQLQVEPAIVTYLVRNMERSAEMASKLVAEIDLAALSDQRRITRPMVSSVLQAFASADVA